TIDSSCQRDAHLSLNSLGAISACVEFTGGCRAEQALAVGVPRIGDVLPSLVDVEGLGLCIPPSSGDLDGLGDATTAKLAVSCQKFTAAAGRKLLGQRLTVARNCVDGL